MLEQAPERLISAQVINEYEAALAEHRQGRERSGNLTASMLGNPYQWILLKMLGIDSKVPDEYAMRLFKRGDHVEEFLIGKLKPLEAQKDIVYRNVTGRVDAIVDTKGWDNEVGIIPLEAKSVKNSAYKWIVGNTRRPGDGAKRGHKLQAALYALAEKTDHFAVTYIASDDYRTSTFIHRTEDYKHEVDLIISTAYRYLQAGKVPEFKSIEKWQENPQYCSYPSWQYLSESEIDNKLKNQYPEAYKRLKQGVNREAI